MAIRLERVRLYGGTLIAHASVRQYLPKSHLPAGDMPLHSRYRQADGFMLDLRADGTAVVYADSRRERMYAENALCDAGSLAPGLYAAAPAFRIRGLIEGFYGPPWSMAQRRHVLHMLARNGINEYFYGPKDDPLHRDRWRDLYEGADAGLLQDMIRTANGLDLRFRYLLAPGLDIRYTDEIEHTILYEKYRQVHRYGVKDFGLLLDDLSHATLHEADRAVFPREVDAHIDLVNRLWASLQQLDPACTLVVCPTQYWGDTAGQYLTALGAGIPKEIGLFFTGREICSASITCADAMAFAAHTGRPPLYWDNYPVNDAEMVDECHIGPYGGRDAGLGGFCDGVVLNPMEFARLSLIPLLTAADFLWQGGGYDPAAAYRRAAADVLGGDMVAPAVRFADFCWRSCLTRCGFHFRYAAPTGGNPSFEAAYRQGAGAVAAYARESKALFEALAAHPDREFVRSAARWLDAAAAFCDGVLSALEGGDPRALRQYLYRAEDVMKEEARRVLDLCTARN